MLPTLTGGLNLAVTFTANMAGLVVAWAFLTNGGSGSQSAFGDCHLGLPPYRRHGRPMGRCSIQ